MSCASATNRHTPALVISRWRSAPRAWVLLTRCETGCIRQSRTMPRPGQSREVQDLAETGTLSHVAEGGEPVGTAHDHQADGGPDRHLQRNSGCALAAWP